MRQSNERGFLDAHLEQSFKNVPNDHIRSVPNCRQKRNVPKCRIASNGSADVLVATAKTRQSGNLPFNFGGIDLLVMPPKLKGRLPLWRVCSVELLRGLVKPRN